MPTCIADQKIYVNNERIVQAGEEFEHKGPVSTTDAFHLKSDDTPKSKAAAPAPSTMSEIGKADAEARAKAQAGLHQK